jgi:hypothetical protein
MESMEDEEKAAFVSNNDIDRVHRLYQDFIRITKYSRWKPQERRRETWEETVSRYCSFMREHLSENNGYNLDDEEYSLIYNAILNMEVMPSMRALTVAGEALRLENVAGYNCAYIKVDNQRAFGEILYILMCGTGVGFSVERQYINKLPVVPSYLRRSNILIVVKDSKLGWSEAVDEFINFLYDGVICRWDISNVRPAGTPLKTFGGRASGPEPLVKLFKSIAEVFNSAQGRKLNSIECHDLVCKIAYSVVTGGVRRCLPWYSKVLILKDNNFILKNICDIKVSDMVFSDNGVRPVINIFNQDSQKCLRIHHQNGYIDCTPNHRLAMAHGFNVMTNKLEHIWREARNLLRGNCLCTYKVDSNSRSYTFTPVSIEFIEELKEELETYDIEVEDDNCFVCENILVHNSALLSLSNLSDSRMRNAKSGDWWVQHPYRALANNSVAFTEKPDIGIFMEEWLSLYKSKSGERGIFNRNACKRKVKHITKRNPHYDFGCNPCSEIILRNKEFCNLSEVVIRNMDDEAKLLKKVEIAAIIGTIQTTLTNFKFVSEDWRNNCIEEALLGLSLTGIMDNPLFAFPSEKLKELLFEMKRKAIETNEVWAQKLGINRAMAITTIKPSGTVSQLVNCSSGIHPRHSKYFIRRVRNNVNDPLTNFLIDKEFPNEREVTDDNTMVFSFPIKPPENCIIRNDISAIEHLNLWKFYQGHWCEHKPSITVNIKEDEWLDVGAWVWRNFDDVSGISFLPYDGGIYQQAPYEEITEEEHLRLVSQMPVNINWLDLAEYDSEETLVMHKEYACTGNECEL